MWANPEFRLMTSDEWASWVEVAKQRVLHMHAVNDRGKDQPYDPRGALEWSHREAPNEHWTVGDGWVYAARTSKGNHAFRFLKIGYSKDPEVRKKDLAKTWGDLKIVRSWPNEMFSERLIHRVLASCRVPSVVMENGDGHTEWFLALPVVAQMCAVFDVVWNSPWDEIDEVCRFECVQWGEDSGPAPLLIADQGPGLLTEGPPACT